MKSTTFVWLVELELKHELVSGHDKIPLKLSETLRFNREYGSKRMA